MREERAGVAGTPRGLRPALGGVRGEPGTTLAWWEVNAEAALPPAPPQFPQLPGPRSEVGRAAASAKAALFPLQPEECLGSESAQAALIPSGRPSSVTPHLGWRSGDAGGSEGPMQR